MICHVTLKPEKYFFTKVPSKNKALLLQYFLFLNVKYFKRHITTTTTKRMGKEIPFAT